MATVTITKENFQSNVLNSKLPVMLDFWAPWCGPCRMVGPIMEELSGEVAGKAVIGKINVDEELELAQQFGIMSIPTVMVFNGGIQKSKSIGFKNKAELRNMLGV